MSHNVTMCNLESAIFPTDNTELVLNSRFDYQHKGAQHECAVSNRNCHTTKGRYLIALCVSEKRSAHSDLHTQDTCKALQRVG